MKTTTPSKKRNAPGGVRLEGAASSGAPPPRRLFHQRPSSSSCGVLMPIRSAMSLCGGRARRRLLLGGRALRYLLVVPVRRLRCCAHVLIAGVLR